MSLYRRPKSQNFWCRFQLNGQEIRLSTGTRNRRQAEEFETAARDRAWRQAKLGERQPYTWRVAASRWLAETEKLTKDKDEAILRWFDEHLKDADVQGITREVLDGLRALKAEETSQATANRYMALMRAILNKCQNVWGVLDSAPKVPMYRERVTEPNYLTAVEFERLVKELPEHLKPAAQIAVLTGLRMRAMLSLEWSRVDLEAKRAWIPAHQMKAGYTHGIPLSNPAVAVLTKLRGLSPETTHVFTWRGKAIKDCNGHAFKEAVRRAGLEPLRWHDLRHTFASWAAQEGVTMHELMLLGAWKSPQMALRYAHLGPDQLAGAAEKVGAASRIGGAEHVTALRDAAGATRQGNPTTDGS